MSAPNLTDSQVWDMLPITDLQRSALYKEVFYPGCPLEKKRGFDTIRGSDAPELSDADELECKESKKLQAE